MHRITGIAGHRMMMTSKISLERLNRAADVFFLSHINELVFLQPACSSDAGTAVLPQVHCIFIV